MAVAVADAEDGAEEVAVEEVGEEAVAWVDPAGVVVVGGLAGVEEATGGLAGETEGITSTTIIILVHSILQCTHQGPGPSDQLLVRPVVYAVPVALQSVPRERST